MTDILLRPVVWLQIVLPSGARDANDDQYNSAFHSQSPSSSRSSSSGTSFELFSNAASASRRTRR
jgi:hypothetical protein